MVLKNWVKVVAGVVLIAQGHGVDGNTESLPGDQYSVQIDGAGNSTQIIDPGTVTLLGGDVDVTSPTGTFLVNRPYLIIRSNMENGLTGTFSQVVPHGFFNAELVKGQLTYDSQSGYLTMRTTLKNCAETQNQELVAYQLDQTTNPPTDLQAVLQALVAQSCIEVGSSLDLLSGEQYATEMSVADITNRQFIRRLYDPLRDLIKTPPCFTSYYNQPCCKLSLEGGSSFWIEGGGSRINIDNGHEGYGLNANGYEIVGCVQYTFDYDWTLGLGVGYFQDDIHFKLPGHGKMNTIDCGLYGLYRPDGYYLVADLTFGATSDKVVRRIAIGDTHTSAHGKSHIYQTTFYGEAGFDYTLLWPYFGCILAQPFLGLEVGYTHRRQIKESGAGSLDLEIGSKNFFKGYSRLGVHLNTMPEFGQMQLMLDLAWVYRLSAAGRTNSTRFSAFGNTFNIQGAPEEKSCLEGILNLTVPVGTTTSFYLELVGEKWQTACAYSVLGGVQVNW